MAESKGDKIEVKKLNSSDLSTEEIAKAIEKTASINTNKKASVVKDEDSSVEQKPTKDTVDSVKIKVKTDSLPSSPVAEEQPSNEPAVEPDEKTTNETDANPPPQEAEAGTIIKRHSGYIKPLSAGNQTDATALSQNDISPPSAKQRIVAVPSSSPELEAEKTDETNSADEEEPKEEPTVDATEDEPVNNHPDDLASDKTEIAKEPKVEDQPVTPEPTTPKVSQKIDQQAKKLGAESAPEVDALQNPKVFDTNQYHLPIKAKATRYVNTAVSWVILLIFLIASAGYVMFELGIVTLDDIKLF